MSAVTSDRQFVDVRSQARDVSFSNRPFGVKRFQTFHHRHSVGVARGLVLLFGIGTRALVWGFLCQGVRQGGEAFPSSVFWFEFKARFFVPI